MGYSMSDAESSMTVFYSPNTGKVKACCGGMQTMDYFGEDKDDYNYDVLVVPYDQVVILNSYNFKVIDGKLSYSPDILIELNKY